MATRKRPNREALDERLQDMQSWLLGALVEGEMREARIVDAAAAAYVGWILDVWDNDGGDVDGALMHALVAYVESCVGWADNPETFRELAPSAEPAWDLAEFHLVVAYTLATAALSSVNNGTGEGLALAGILYGDAIEAREHWMTSRGPGRARNPDTRLGRVYAAALDFERRIAGAAAAEVAVAAARTRAASKAASAKHATSPKRAAKAAALTLWIERHAGLHPKLRTVEQYAAEVMRRWPVLTSPTVIARWSAQWTKDVREGRAPRC